MAGKVLSSFAYRGVTPGVLAFCSLSLLGGLPAGRAEEESAAPPSPGRIVRLTLSGPLHEGAPPLGLFGELSGAGLRPVLDAIERAREDASVAGFILRLDNPILGWTQTQTLRRALIALREAGKPSYCHVDFATTATYLLASACSEVSIHPAGLIELPGVQATKIFLKDLLDKVGVDIQELRMGRYKSAAEMLTRNEPSPPVEEETQAILDGLYEDLIAAIAQNRSRPSIEARALIDQRLFSATDALAAKCVDRIEYRDEFEARIRGEEPRLDIVDARLSRQLDTDYSGFAGMMKLFNELLGVRSEGRVSATPKVALIVAEGPILDDMPSFGFGSTAAITPKEMAEAFRKAREEESVKAVVLRVNSPGGSALASDAILREVEITAAQKPVVVSMGDLAASGGYYISCRATRIFAESGTLTGSIGVIGAIPSVRPLFEKIGVRFETVSRGKRAEVISPYGELSAEGRDLYLEYMQDIYDRFLQHVAAGRELSLDAVASVAEGRVWTGRQALDLGLVDELGGVDEALAHARELGSVDADSEPLLLPRPKSFFEVLQGGVSARGLLFADILDALPPELARTLGRLAWLADVRGARVLAIMSEFLFVH